MRHQQASLQLCLSFRYARFANAAPSTCSNGMPGVSDGSVCCKEECGMCGGPGCGAVVGTNGASDCCPGTIVEESGGEFCGDAPCVMSGFTPSPVNPAFDGTAAPVGGFRASSYIEAVNYPVAFPQQLARLNRPTYAMARMCRCGCLFRPENPAL